MYLNCGRKSEEKNFQFLVTLAQEMLFNTYKICFQRLSSIVCTSSSGHFNWTKILQNLMGNFFQNICHGSHFGRRENQKSGIFKIELWQTIKGINIYFMFVLPIITITNKPTK